MVLKTKEITQFLRPKIEGKYLDPGNATDMFILQLLKSFNVCLILSQSEHRNLGCQKSDKIGTKWVLEKVI